MIEKIENDELMGLPYNKEPLKKYLHIHHNAYAGFGASLVRNIKEYWFSRNGIIHTHRIEDFENLDNRRIAVGLPPWQLEKDIYELIRKKYGF